MKKTTALILMISVVPAQASMITYTVSDLGFSWFLQGLEELKGPIKKFTEYSTYIVNGKEQQSEKDTVYEFSRSGHLTKRIEGNSTAELTWAGGRLAKVVITYEGSTTTQTYEYDSNGCLTKTTSKKNGEPPSIFAFKCVQIADGGTRRIRLTDPAEYTEFDNKGRVVFVQNPKEWFLEKKGVSQGLSKRRITYEMRNKFTYRILETDVTETPRDIALEEFIQSPENKHDKFLYWQSSEIGGSTEFRHETDKHNNWTVKQSLKVINDGTEEGGRSIERTTYRKIQYWE